MLLLTIKNRAFWGRTMAANRPAAFNTFACPHCNALYQLVKGEAGPETVDLGPCLSISELGSPSRTLAGGGIASRFFVVIALQRERKVLVTYKTGVSHGINSTVHTREIRFRRRSNPPHGEAMDAACEGLRDTGQPALVREIIAKRIIEAAKKSERDQVRLRAAGLAALGYDREVI